MNRCGHYAEAEKLLERAAGMPGIPEARALVARAHVHALLAGVPEQSAKAGNELNLVRDRVAAGEML